MQDATRPTIIDLTPEDRAILERCPVRFNDSQRAEGEGHDDLIDYRAMLAREITRERNWRMFFAHMTPAACANTDRLAYEREDVLSVRDWIEYVNGEALA